MSNIHADWSPDGRYVVYSTERINKGINKAKYGFDIMLLDIQTGISRNLGLFTGAMNLNPVFSGDDILFLSDRDGFRNMYIYEISRGKVYRMTKYPTGISGITAYSPAISVSSQAGNIAYTYYFADGYQIYLANINDFNPVEVDPLLTDFSAGTLPPLEHLVANIVDDGLYGRDESKLMPADSFANSPTVQDFSLLIFQM
jgi:hypothetical protein